MADRENLATGNHLVVPSKPPIQYRVAVALTVINVLGLGYAVGTGEGGHALVHCVLTVVFGSWAWSLRQNQNPVASELQPAPEELERLEALEAESSRLQLELGEMQERLDFVERMVAQKQDAPRMGS